LFLISELKAQDYSLTNYNIGNGLSTAKIYSIAQDSLNRIWCATAYGVSMYDGYKWTNWKSLTEYSRLGFKKVVIDTKGFIWLIPIMTNEKILVLKNENWETIQIPEALINRANRISDFNIFYMNDKPVVSIASLGGIFLLTDKKWQRIDNNNSALPEAIFSLINEKNLLYLATSKGLSSLEISPKFKIKIKNQLFGIEDTVLSVTSSRFAPESFHLWVLTKRWMGEIIDNKLKQFPLNSEIHFMSEFLYYYIAEGENGYIYFGNKVSKYRYDLVNDIFIPLNKEWGFASDGATSLFIDKENNIWFTDTRGIDKVTYHIFANYYQSSGMLEDEVTAVLEYQPNKFLLGHNSGFSFFKDNKFSKYSFSAISNKKEITSRIMDLTIDNKGRIWAACGFYGLLNISEDGTYTRYPPEQLNSVTSIIWDEKYGLLVASDYGLFKLEGNQFVLIDENMINKNFRKIFKFGDNIYLTSLKGLFKLKDNKITEIIESKDPRITSTFSVYQELNGDLLVGTENGLYLFSNGKLTKFKKNGFSIERSVFFVMKDKFSNYWFGTADGLTRWDGKANNFNYTKEDGLAGYETNRSAGMIDSKNNFWVGTNTGLSRFSDRNLRIAFPYPKILFLQLETNSGDQYPLTASVSLPHDQNTLQFNIRAVSFINENSIEYRVKLEGFDRDFYTIKQPQLYSLKYNNLPSGSYRLIVMAKNRFSIWSPPSYTSSLFVEKPFYFRLWFLLTLAAFFVGAIVFVSKYYIVNKEQSRLEAMVTVRTKELSDSEEKLKHTLDHLEDEVKQRTEELEHLNRTKDKMFSIISHDLRSPFMSILGFAEILDEDMDEMDRNTIQSYAKKILNSSRSTVSLIDGLLEWSRLQMGGIIPEHEEVEVDKVIEDVLKLFRPQLAKKEIALETDLQDKTTLITDPNILKSIIRNILSNAIKFTKKEGFISISSKYEDGFHEISVSDSGIGMTQEMVDNLFILGGVQSRKGTSNERGTGLGLNITYDFLKKIGGTISIQSEVGVGSTFIIILKDSVELPT
jgi:signal transduction histidine kinase/ligand-binding sensor domain-containing protein